MQVTDKQPWVYLECGHVHGHIEWGKHHDGEQHMCPLCRSVSCFSGDDGVYNCDVIIDYNTSARGGGPGVVVGRKS